jgi:methionyl-tRNA synthetase
MSEETPENSGSPEISIDDFAKVELLTARVKTAELHPDADRLLILKLDDGSELGRSICAGIRQWWQPEDLVGKDVIIVSNLKPRKVRGVLSEGMLLAVQDGDDVVPLSVMKPVRPGNRIS